jgi:hypothetical protein
MNSWTVDIFVERLAFYSHIKCKDCKDDGSFEDEMKPILVLTKVESNHTFPLCRSQIFEKIQEYLQNYFM